jgi:hypothetical protein
MAHRILRSATAAPPWIASPGSRTRLRAELTRLAEAANRTVLRLNSEAPTPRQHRRPVDAAELLTWLDVAFDRR